LTKRAKVILCLLGFVLTVLAVRLIFVLSTPAPYEMTKVANVPKCDKPSLVEFPAEAVPLWRCEEVSPSLILFSSDPFLEFPPEENSSKAVELFRTGSSAEISRRVRFEISDPLLLPNNTMRMALRSGVISELVWVLPVDEKGSLADTNVLYDWLLQQEQFSAEEKESMKPTAEGVVGVVEKRPFRAVAASILKTWPQKARIHVDLTFVDTLYQNEINTPIYLLLKTRLYPVFSKENDPGKVSVSYSTANGDVSVQLRFVGETLVDIAGDPAILDRPLNDIWRGRRDILYLENFHQLEKMLRIASDNVASLPENASGYFDLYRVFYLRKDMESAIRALESACKLDLGYVPAFRSLARQAYQQGDFQLAVSYLKRAFAIDPANPFIQIDLVDSLLMSGQRDEATHIVNDLKKLHWSEIYYPMMTRSLENLLMRSTQEKKGKSVKERTDNLVPHY